MRTKSTKRQGVNATANSFRITHSEFRINIGGIILLKIALAQMEVRADHPDINVAKMLKFIDDAKSKEADIIIFPFYAVSGTLNNTAFDRSAFFEDLQTYQGE